MREEFRNILVGAITLVVLAVAAVFTFGERSLGKSSGETIRASFNRIDGLNVGDEVRMSGIKIGQVAGMHLGTGYSAIVDIRLDTPVEIPTDSSASINTDSLFGSKHVVLVPGGNDDLVKPDGMITLTQDSVVVSELLDMIIGEAKANQAKMKTAATKPPASGGTSNQIQPQDQSQDQNQNKTESEQGQGSGDLPQNPLLAPLLQDK